ncbi:MAG: hypothetical protein AAB931_00345 [Patescibacteria group bacterium]
MRYKLILQSLIFTAVALTLLRIGVANSISTSGVELGKINETVNNYWLENYLLSEKLLSQSSLSAIASEAAKLGFADTNESFVLNNPLPLAVRQ